MKVKAPIGISIGIITEKKSVNVNIDTATQFLKLMS